MATAVYLLVQKCHLLSESEFAFLFILSAAFVDVNVNRLMENKNNSDKKVFRNIWLFDS